MRNSDLNAERIDILRRDLNKSIPDQSWSLILETFVPSGVANALHLRQSSGLNRDKLRRVIDKMQAACVGIPPLVKELDHSIKRPGERGRTPAVYLLAESGAALLAKAGHDGIRACGLNSDRSISHALAMLDFHLAAVQNGYTVKTDSEIFFSDGQNLRPDHQVMLSDGRILLFEIEQSAQQEIIRRIKESVELRQKFFKSEQSRPCLTEIRMLVNLPRNREWYRTMKTWRQVVSLSSKNGNLGYRLLALPLADFLLSPEWDQEPSSRWDDLTVPEDDQSAEVPNISAVVKDFDTTHSAREDLLVLSALLQQFKENKLPSMPSPDRQFLDLVYLIYTASHPDQQISIRPPHASIYLLRCYLEMHPSLQESLKKALHRGRGKVHWNTTTILHRMQNVIDAFLGFHGWQSGGALIARASIGDQNQYSKLSITVHLAPQLPGKQHKYGEPSFSDALSWVLMALFDYADDLGLGRPEFW